MIYWKRWFWFSLTFRLCDRLQLQCLRHPIYLHALGKKQPFLHCVLEPGLVWTFLIARQTNRFCEHNHLDLFGTLPIGKLGVLLMMSGGTMHRLIQMNQYMWLAMWIMRFLIVMIWINNAGAHVDNLFCFYIMLSAWLIPVAALYMLYLYDIALGLLLGLLFPLSHYDRSISPYIATITHIGLLLTPVMTGSWLHLLISLYARSLWTYIGVTLLNVVGIIVFCEAVTHWLWNKLISRLDIAARDANQMLGNNRV